MGSGEHIDELRDVRDLSTFVDSAFYIDPIYPMPH